MPIDVKQVDDGLGFIFHVKGTVTGQEILDSIDEEFLSSSKKLNYIYGLSDFSQIDKINFLFSEIDPDFHREGRSSELKSDLILAIVAPNHFIYNMSKMFITRTEILGWKTDVFFSPAEAQDWVRKEVKERHGHDLTLQ